MADSLDSLRRALVERYVIERELGRGGSAVVYLAHDVKHHRKVALKVLLPELALSVRTERFLREIQIAARLTHPRILTLIESGRAGDALFYVMPYVEGESLRDRINRKRQLPLDEALRIVAEVASALDYAQAQGVVHRDIKPENIMLSTGGAIVADFGIARALSVAGETGVTEGGVAVGTPAYMSPEQAGGGAVDGRSDVYSLGCVVYEMLVGHPPFTGSTAQEILGRHALDPVPSLRAARPDAPAALEQAINRALAKVPAGRFESASAFAQALAVPQAAPRIRPVPWLVGTGALAVLVLLLIIGQGWFAPASNAASLAVLPCTNLTTDPENDYFSEGVAAELINDLSVIPGLTVPGFTSSLEARKNGLSRQEVSRQLGVGHVLECSVRRAGGRLRVAASLVNAGGHQLWTDTYDRQLQGMNDVIAVQEEIARHVLAAMRLKFDQGGSLGGHSTRDVEAHNLYIQGRYSWNRMARDRVTESIKNLKAAIARDPDYALAWSALADAYWRMRVLGYAPYDDVFPLEKEAALKAVALDSALAEAHASLASAFVGEYDWTNAESHYRLAIRLNPNYGWAHSGFAYALTTMGRFDEAVVEAREAIRLDPLSASAVPGEVLLFAGQTDEAIRAFKQIVALEPDGPGMHGNLGWAYLEKGMLQEAIAEAERARDLGSFDAAGLSVAYARAGRQEEALALARRMEAERRWRPAVFAYTALGDLDAAFRNLDKVLADRFLGVRVRHPRLAPLRSNPRFREVLRQMNLER